MKTPHFILTCLISSFSAVLGFYFMSFFSSDSLQNRDLAADRFLRQTAACVMSIEPAGPDGGKNYAAMSIPSLSENGEPVLDKNDYFKMRSGPDGLHAVIEPSPASSRPAVSLIYTGLKEINFGYTGDLFYTIRAINGREYLHNYRIKKGCIMSHQEGNK